MKNAKFSCNGKEFAKALSRLQNLAGGPLFAVAIKTTKIQIELHADLNNRRVIVLLPATVEHKGLFIINKADFEAVVKNKDSIEFEVKDNSIKFKTGRMFGNIPLLATPPELKLLEFQVDNFNVPDKLVADLQAAIKKCQLVNVYATDRLALFIQLRDDNLYVAVNDPFHAAIVTIPVKKLAKELAWLINPVVLPLEYSQILATAFKNKVAISLNKANVVLADETTLLELPMLQTTPAMLEALLSIEVTDDFVIDADELNNTLDSCNFDNAKLTFILEKKAGLKIQFKSDHAKIVNEIKADGLQINKKLNIDTRNLKDVAKKLSGKITVSLNESAICLSQDNVKYYSQLLQDTEKG